MKTVVIERELNAMLQQHDSFLNRSGIRIFTAASTDDLLQIHRAERADLIIAPLDLPGSMEQVCMLIREDADLRDVRLIIACNNSRSAIEQCSRCRPQAVILRPVNPLVLLARAQQMLDIAWRETFRALINVEVLGRADNAGFYCRSLDISVSGMLIETDKPLARGRKISCSFFLPDMTQIQAAGEIVRVVEQPDRTGARQYGVKFLELSSEARQAVKDYIDVKSGSTTAQ